MVDHTVKSFDSEISQLRGLIAEMGGLAEVAIRDAIDALVRHDDELARQVVAADARLDALEAEVDRLAVRTIALRAPMADDLREIISAIKIAGELERVGDYAKNIAKRVPVIGETAPVAPAVIVPEMAKLVVRMIEDAIAAYIGRDVALAKQVIEADTAADEFYNSLFRSLLVHMIENPQQTTQSAHLLFVAKNLERVGDHATNIAEMVCYTATGEPGASRASTAGAAYEPLPAPADR